MSFSDRITSMPVAYDPDRGDEARAALPGLSGVLADLVGGAAGCSPYLSGLIGKEADWLPGALDAPENAVTAEFARINALAPDMLNTGLRQAKRRIALLTALADLGGVWPLELVTGTLSDLADLACDRALKTAIATQINRGKLPGMTVDDIDTAGGMVVLAMGKMGAQELNYSSDIDLICLFDESRFDRDDFHDARTAFIRATRQMSAALNDLTGDGYVFRTDLRLRPDPAVTPVCIAMEAAMRYYESLGRTWERAAYIKARPAAGDLAAGNRFLGDLTPFVWRRHLDFAAIQDAHDMRLRIREHKGLGGPMSLPGHNMKLGRGGIREIEFFTQTRQIIAGGRDTDLRVRGTVDGLRVLAAKGWVPEDVTNRLTDHYRAHRTVEHRLQMVHDAQTHDLPNSEAGFDRIAAMMGTDRATFEKDILERLTEVHALTEGFFAPDASASAPFPEPEFETDVMARWYSYPAFRSDRAVQIFKRLRPEILSRLSRAAKPEEALSALDGFLAGLPAGVQLFSLFEANPVLIDLLVDIVGTSPALATHLARNAGVLDAVIGGDFFADWPGLDALKADLDTILAREPDYEAKLDTTRRWAKEWHFRIGVHHLRGLVDAVTAGQHYADLAQAVLAGLWPVVVAEFSTKHGTPPGRGASVLAMGSLGVGQLSSSSDLDVIVIYDADGVEMSDGRRPLAARPYYARLTQAFITALTARMAQGRLYEVDMRLRPSGNQGPVATSLASFRDYQETQAWTWEHLALTRARVVAGDPDLGAEIEAVRTDILSRPRDTEDVRTEVARMRARISAAKTPNGPWDTKIGPGRMQDIELVAQAGALVQGGTARDVASGVNGAVAIGWLDDAGKAALLHAYRLSWITQLSIRLLSETLPDTDQIGQGGAAFLMRQTGHCDLDALSADLESAWQAAAQAIDVHFAVTDTEDEQ
jgi:[glutamine synthetase] adenylyltransferase / [glutamine synthetase]-adenylyl-L-tyrosine phosphorylase